MQVGCWDLVFFEFAALPQVCLWLYFFVDTGFEVEEGENSTLSYLVVYYFPYLHFLYLPKHPSNNLEQDFAFDLNYLLYN